MSIYLVRHGETRWNVARRLQGRTDSPLTLRGLEQIHGYGQLLRSRIEPGADVHLCASPLQRTRQTASLLAEILELSMDACSESELLLERYCGDWEGCTLADLEARDGAQVQLSWKGWDTPIGGDGETLEQVQARAHGWLALPREAASTIVVTHGVMSRQFRGAYLGLGPEDTMTLERHTQDTVFHLHDGTIEALATGAALQPSTGPG